MIASPTRPSGTICARSGSQLNGVFLDKELALHPILLRGKLAKAFVEDFRPFAAPVYAQTRLPFVSRSNLSEPVTSE